MKKKQDQFIKLNDASRLKRKDVEMSHELDVVKKLEVSRIKTKVERKLLIQHH